VKKTICIVFSLLIQFTALGPNATICQMLPMCSCFDEGYRGRREE